MEITQNWPLRLKWPCGAESNKLCLGNSSWSNVTGRGRWQHKQVILEWFSNSWDLRPTVSETDRVSVAELKIVRSLHKKTSRQLPHLNRWHPIRHLSKLKLILHKRLHHLRHHLGILGTQQTISRPGSQSHLSVTVICYSYDLVPDKSTTIHIVLSLYSCWTLPYSLSENLSNEISVTDECDW